MKIEPNQPHIILEIDALGNIKSEACNYPNQNGVCQGKLATQPFEQALADNKLIPPPNQLSRQYKQEDISTKQKAQIDRVQQQNH